MTRMFYIQVGGSDDYTPEQETFTDPERFVERVAILAERLQFKDGDLQIWSEMAVESQMPWERADIAVAEIPIEASFDNAAHAQYRERIKVIEELFRKELEELFDMNGRPPLALNLLWQKAWDDGHAEGYRRVEEIYEELASIVKAV